MSNLASNIGRVAVSGRSLWWVAGAIAAGIAVPVIIGAAMAILAYYPLGSFLPRVFFYSSFGTVLVIGAIGLIVVAVGIGYSILALDWRPLFLSVITAGVMVPGMYPGVAAHFYLRRVAFEAIGDRSSELVEAIKRYERDTGGPPDVITDLVPRYLPKIPHTGMSAYPEYEYVSAPEYCSAGNTWSITVYVGSFDVFFYCPKRDYPSKFERIGDWAYFRD